MAQPDLSRSLTIEEVGVNKDAIQNASAMQAAIIADNLQRQMSDGDEGEEDSENVKAFKQRVLMSSRFICAAYKLQVGGSRARQSQVDGKETFERQASKDSQQRRSSKGSGSETEGAAMQALSEKLSERIDQYGKLVQTTWGKDASGAAILRSITSEMSFMDKKKKQNQTLKRFLAYAIVSFFLVFIMFKEIPEATKPYDLKPPGHTDSHEVSLIALPCLWRAVSASAVPMAFAAIIALSGGAVAGGRRRQREHAQLQQPLLLSA